MAFPKNIKKWLYPLLIIAGAMGVFAFLKATKPVQPPVEITQKRWAVQAQTLTLQTLAPMHTLYGKVESTKMVAVVAPVSGVVERLPLKSGEHFEPGALIVAMADTDLNLPLAIAQADVDDIAQQLKLEKLAFENDRKRLAFETRLMALNSREVERSSRLLKKDLASQAVLDQAKAVLIRQEQVVAAAQLTVAQHQAKQSQLEARLAKAKATLMQRRVNLERGQLKADFKGRIAEVLVAEGSQVSQGAALLRFYPLDSLELRAKLPSTERRSVYDSLQSSRPMYAVFEMQGHHYQLPLNRLAGESETSGVDAFFALPAALGVLRPGDMIDVQFYQSPVQDVFPVPLTAVYGRERVYVIEQGHLQKRQIKVVGETKIDGVMHALLQGDLQAGEQLLTTHLPNAMTGLSVMVIE
ncbi:secretion protein HlyD [Hydrogenovibrio sp. SC-1]|uniref:efflux RND transporter periplasmic adaptor subunit n=1 Tax=Hydrogenovibrio sp. SC-1 TaxID=2065820 RepID=UPI000C7E3BEB|nr:HlyD family efflux transporter periplasmic adaptor subunit [Hydrogenovibrio sp. SC-1]PLA74023.1 secretion protein HlyD [Hydrogenovibrio sp. SC-1]